MGAWATGGEATGGNLQSQVAMCIPINFLVALIKERGEFPRQIDRAQAGKGQINDDLMALADMAQIGLELEGHLGWINAGFEQAGFPLRFEQCVDRIQFRQGLLG